MSISEKINEKLVDALEHFKNHYNKEESSSELYEMCKMCKSWTGADHDYTKCENKSCFKFWLAYVYLKWDTAWE